MTVGCVACPAGLEFNEEINACLYERRYVTEPSQGNRTTLEVTTTTYNKLIAYFVIYFRKYLYL